MKSYYVKIHYESYSALTCNYLALVCFNIIQPHLVKTVLVALSCKEGAILQVSLQESATITVYRSNPYAITTYIPTGNRNNIRSFLYMSLSGPHVNRA